jgi:acetylornithine deacetylase/succinyl-diaminopimelate desuccinylase-like protein
VAQAHAPDEHVALDELTRAVALFRGVFQASRSGDGAG